jgi:translation initiation factor IF-3
LNSQIRINDAIRSPEVRVIGVDGEQLGIMSIADAKAAAREAKVDLVEISPTANPPVVKIIDWGKFQYQKMKEQSKSSKKTRSSELKQIRFGLKIGENDLNIKLRKVREFLDDGDRVRLTLVLRGREMAHQELGMDFIKKVADMLSDVAAQDGVIQKAGRNISINIRRKNA